MANYLSVSIFEVNEINCRIMVKNKSKLFGSKNNMKKEEIKEENKVDEILTQEEGATETENLADSNEQTDETVSTPPEINIEDEYKKQITDLQDKYMRMMAEFDNFRKRTLKERMELLKSAGEDILINLLPVVDDFERGLQAMERTNDVEALKSGVSLIYNKFREFLNQRGIKEIEAANQDFNVDLHEAITKIPAPDESQKGKVVDIVQKGYVMNEKVIRFAKVVVGE
jgi:molecular chaperone GrpE